MRASTPTLRARDLLGRRYAFPRRLRVRDGETGAIIGSYGKTESMLTAEPTVVNGSPALAVRLDDEIDGVIAIRVEDGRITGLYYVRDPEKLTRVESETQLTLR